MRIFLEVVRRGSFRSASEHLGHSVNALRRRVEELEHHLGTAVLTRHVDGVRPTTEGEQIFAAAEQMEAASFNLTRARERGASSFAGEVKIAITEGLGTFWLGPRLVEFQRSFPRLLIDLSCAMRSADVLRLEADAAVQLIEADCPGPQGRNGLGDFTAMLFAGQQYIRTFGLPTSYQELLKHRFVLQVADQTSSSELYNSSFPAPPSQASYQFVRTSAVRIIGRLRKAAE